MTLPLTLFMVEQERRLRLQMASAAPLVQRMPTVAAHAPLRAGYVHGSVASYVHLGCRCRHCQDANRDYSRERRRMGR